MPVKPESILKVLAYFDIFNYPLTKEEICFFSGLQMNMVEVEMGLLHLTEEQRVFKLGDFYSLQQDPSLNERRLAGNAQARRLLPKAYRIATFLYQFPFVRGIGISGSLSKNFAGQNSDLDFFIITGANRLWVARTCMHLFKKLTYLTGKQHWYCMNYYIDENALCIEEQNIFTATELVTLIPVCGNGTMDAFFNSNEWAAHYFPNMKPGKKSLLNRQAGWLKKAFEYLLNNDRLDDYLMRLTSKRWMQKEQQQRLNANGNRMGLRNSKHVSKPNPVYFQQKILEAYRQKTKSFSLVHPHLSPGPCSTQL